MSGVQNASEGDLVEPIGLSEYRQASLVSISIIEVSPRPSSELLLWGSFAPLNVADPFCRSCLNKRSRNASMIVIHTIVIDKGQARVVILV